VDSIAYWWRFGLNALRISCPFGFKIPLSLDLETTRTKNYIEFRKSAEKREKIKEDFDFTELIYSGFRDCFFGAVLHNLLWKRIGRKSDILRYNNFFSYGLSNSDFIWSFALRWSFEDTKID